MASQGGKLTLIEYEGEEICSICKKVKAVFKFTCSPQFFEIINGFVCNDCANKCKECTAKNIPEKSDLD